MNQTIPPHSLSSLEASVLLISCNIGGFWLACPHIFYKLGLCLSLVYLSVSLFFSIISNAMMGRLIIQTGAYSYLDIVRSVCNYKVECLVASLLSLGLCLLSIAQVCMDLLFKIDISSGVLNSIFIEVLHPTSATFFKSKGFSIILMGLILLLFVFKRNIKEIRQTAFVVLLLLFFFFMVLVIYSAQNYSALRTNNPHSNFQIPFAPQTHVPQIFGKSTLFSVALGNAHLSVPILNSVRDFSLKNVKSVQYWATAWVFVLIIIFSLLGVAIFGEVVTTKHTLMKVIQSQARSIVSVVAQFAYFLIILFHLPIIIFSTRQAFLQFVCVLHECKKGARRLEEPEDEEQMLFLSEEATDNWGKISKRSAMYSRVPHWVFNLVSLITYLLILVTTLFVKDIDLYFEFTLAPSNALTAQLIPTLCLLTLKRNQSKYNWLRGYLAVVIILMLYILISPIIEIRAS